MKKLFKFTLLVVILSSVSLAASAITSTEVPVFKDGTNVDVTKSGANMNIKINGGNNSVGTANWKSFNIGSNAKVNVNFTAANQTSLNYVDAAGGVSKIYGQLTNSGVGASTGQIILVNPNGFLFGNGANINLNSFTAAAFDGVLNKADPNKSMYLYHLEGKQNANKIGNITVENGAKIYGKDSVTLVGKNVTTYHDSQISTSKAGKVHIATGDNNDIFIGLGNRYDKNEQISDVSSKYNPSNKTMKISLNGEITAGRIDIANYSKNTSSKINVSNSVIKANGAANYKGGIYLYSRNNVHIDNSKISSNAGVEIDANNKLHIDNTKISAKGSDLVDVGISLSSSDLHIDNSDVSSVKRIHINGVNKSHIDNAKITASKGYIYIDGIKKLHIDNTELNAKNSYITLASSQGSVSIDNNALKANNVTISAEKKVSAYDNYIQNKGEILLQAKNTKNISFYDNTVKKNNVKQQVKPEPKYYY